MDNKEGKIVFTVEITVPFSNWEETVGGANRFVAKNVVEWAIANHDTTTAAAKSVGTDRGNFLRLCRKYKILTKHKRSMAP